MRVYQRVLLVAVLTLGMIAAGIVWERFYVAPLVEQARRKPDPPDTLADDLPPECLEELATMGQPAADINPFSGRSAATERSLAAAKEASSEPSPTTSDNVLRPGTSSNRMAMHVEVEDDARSPAQVAHDATARPHHHVRSAEWTEPVTEPPPGHRSQPETLPGSAAQSLLHDNARDGLKTVDVLDLMRRLRADDGNQRTEARRELLRRGFSEVDLELARRLFSPDPEARKQLARELPKLSSVDAVQWLWWLALDAQPEVRVVAVSMLATTGDPALLDRVENLARNDHDPQVQALADQIAKQRELSEKQGDAMKR